MSPDRDSLPHFENVLVPTATRGGRAPLSLLLQNIPIPLTSYLTNVLKAAHYEHVFTTLREGDYERNEIITFFMTQLAWNFFGDVLPPDLATHPDAKNLKFWRAKSNWKYIHKLMSFSRFARYRKLIGKGCISIYEMDSILNSYRSQTTQNVSILCIDEGVIPCENPGESGFIDFGSSKPHSGVKVQVFINITTSYFCSFYVPNSL